MTVHFYFHDTTAAVTKLHIRQRMFGKCRPQISRMLWQNYTARYEEQKQAEGEVFEEQAAALGGGGGGL